MKKAHREALEFAYRLTRGDFDGKLLPYAVGYWIEPDRAQDRPYLNETVFSVLLTRGYMECALFIRRHPVYLYRITEAGCVALGREWPVGSPYQPNYKNGHWYGWQKSKNRRFPFPPRRQPPVLAGGKLVYSAMRLHNRRV
ncbi:MAG TPA: hypothetical protein VHO69_02920 [Phototrophicaceae bacterium]|nr:hypothetical protein [Phototrophicaceae bacterium]